MNTYIPDKNFWCKICGEPEKDKPNHKHHVFPLMLGGKDLNPDGTSNRIVMCNKCHNILHNTYPKIIWDYLHEEDKDKVRKALNYFVRSKVRYNDHPKTITEPKTN